MFIENVMRNGRIPMIMICRICWRQALDVRRAIIFSWRIWKSFFMLTTVTFVLQQVTAAARLVQHFLFRWRRSRSGMEMSGFQCHSV